MKGSRSSGVVAAAVAVVMLGAGAGPQPPEIPAHVSITVSPEAVAPGGAAQVTLRLAPIEGVKINRYPQVKLQVPAADGLVAEAEGRLGDSKAPAPGTKASNYFAEMEPLKLGLALDPGAARGTHEIDGKLVYYYCMPASGFCAPHRTQVKIPVVVR
jgi:hypothetical protein